MAIPAWFDPAPVYDFSHRSIRRMLFMGGQIQDQNFDHFLLKLRIRAFSSPILGLWGFMSTYLRISVLKLWLIPHWVAI